MLTWMKDWFDAIKTYGWKYSLRVWRENRKA